MFVGVEENWNFESFKSTFDVCSKICCREFNFYISYLHNNGSLFLLFIQYFPLQCSWKVEMMHKLHGSLHSVKIQWEQKTERKLNAEYWIYIEQMRHFGETIEYWKLPIAASYVRRDLFLFISLIPMSIRK